MLCDFSCSVGTCQMSLKCSRCPSDNLQKAAANFVEDKICYSKSLDLSSTSHLSVAHDMCCDSSLEKDLHVYKRRKLLRNSVALLSEENGKEGSKCSGCGQSSITSEAHILTQRNDEPNKTMTNISSFKVAENRNISSCKGCNLQGQGTASISMIDVTQNLASCSNSMLKSRSIGEDKVSVGLLVRDFQNSDAERNSGLNDRCSSSKSNNGQSSGYREKKMEDTEECSSSDNVSAELLNKFTSSKELCIFVLKSHGLLGAVQEVPTCDPIEVSIDGYAKLSQACKICGHSGNLLKMLICDLCEEAFHVSCCTPRIRKIPVDEWYCQGCSGKVLKPLFDERNTSNEQSRHRRCDREQSCILSMLRDNRPYTSGVRIGRDFQVEVPEWSGPIYCDSLPELFQVDPAEFASLSSWGCNQLVNSTSIGNWVQCREVIYTDENDEGTICGKWRRAPLFVVQTDNWDCSCAVQWDPIHADCAVPQELETDVILKHLKFIEALRPRLSNKRKCG